MDFEKELKKYGLKVYHKEHRQDREDPDDYEPIDFSIDDGTDNVAWVWGSHPTNDVVVECNHPEEALDWGDDDECGECLLCGDQCLWHWEEGEEYEGTDDDGHPVSSKWGDRVIDEWHHTGNKGLIGKYLKEMAERW